MIPSLIDEAVTRPLSLLCKTQEPVPTSFALIYTETPSASNQDDTFDRCSTMFSPRSTFWFVIDCFSEYVQPNSWRGFGCLNVGIIQVQNQIGTKPPHVMNITNVERVARLSYIHVGLIFVDTI